MKQPALGELSPADVVRSREVAASTLVSVLEQKVEGQERLDALGNYLIVCALSADENSIEAVKTICQEGLEAAGANPPLAAQTTDLITTNRAVTYVASLSYADKTRPPRGIRYGKKSAWLDPGEFIAGILADS